MDATIQFLWDRRNQPRDLKKSTAWAIHLLEAGHDSDAILRLAGLTAADWHYEQQFVEQALRDIGQDGLLQNQGFYLAFEADLIAAYYAGEISGEELVARGGDLLDEPSLALFWNILGDEAGQHDQGLCFKYRFDLLPYDVALQQALTAHGFPNPGAVK